MLCQLANLEFSSCAYLTRGFGAKAPKFPQVSAHLHIFYYILFFKSEKNNNIIVREGKYIRIRKVKTFFDRICLVPVTGKFEHTTARI